METQTQSILEGNHLIAEFMELAKQSHGSGCLYEDPYSGEYVTAIELSYDESWDWLMPVVEKIEKMVNNVTIDQKYSLIYTGFMFNDKQDFQWQENKGSKLENTYNVVVEFILWYNENK